jgi:hypothetical protein
MCCGNKRAAYRSFPIADRSRMAMPDFAEPVRDPGPRVSAAVLLRSKDTSAIRVRGPVTGKPYEFSSVNPAQRVDPRDAAVLMRGGLFYRA